MRDEVSSAAAPLCCALPVCCVLCAVSLSSVLLHYPAVLTLCSYCVHPYFSTLLQAPVNCWTDFFSFLPWIRHISLDAKIKINFFGVCGWEFSKNSSAVGSKGGTHRGHPFCPEVDGRWKGVQPVRH
jgi:hypothetical protein